MSATPAKSKGDPLLEYRSEFPGLEGSVYMVSHSLGAMPRGAAGAMQDFMNLWRDRSITSWDPWLT